MSLLQSNPASPSVPKEQLDLYSFRYLEYLLGFSRAQLRDLSEHTREYYKPFLKAAKIRPFVRKPVSHKKRLIDNPRKLLKIVQKRINQRLLKPLLLPEYLLGGVRGKCIRDNALLHLGASCIVTIDIKKFFPSITPIQVYRVWRYRLNCSPRIAALLTRLTTHRRYLPQGAATSTLLANLVLSSYDSEIRSACEILGLKYSSWIDDLAFSGPKAHEIVETVIAVLSKAGFRVSHQKVKIMGPGDKKVLNKLVLSKSVSVGKAYMSRLLAGIHNLAIGKVSSTERDFYVRSLGGGINYVNLIQPQKAVRLRKKLQVAIKQK